jgi:hypothetical protein
MYLGHHYSYKREQGEAQVAINLHRAFTDYFIRFTFSKGVHFTSPRETEAIVPNLLKRVWEVDNDKNLVLQEMGQQGAVSGDCFVKVAYEDAWEDSAGRVHPGRVRVLPLNSSYAFPEFHPHDRQRLIRFKLKYRFWGTSREGTRQVYTYTEILTDDVIEEYINDELIDQRPNPLGIIPITHIPNIQVSGSPWGLSDCHDVISVQQLYNEVATDIADIVNYHAAPVTVITGAKASQLEKGAKKVWGGLPKDAQVFNLEGGGAGLQGALAFLDMLKQRMHEMTGIPETALGQMQPISNTSGVALSIQFQPLMNHYAAKTNQYGAGLKKINEHVLLTLAIKEPQAFVYDDTVSGAPPAGSLPALDLADPITYQSDVLWPPPLPLDKLVLLNEISMMMGIGLESREGALRALGEEFPAEKLAEIRNELLEDARSDGALQLLKAQISKEIMDLTAMQVGPDGTAMPLMEPGIGSDGTVGGPGAGQVPMDPASEMEFMEEMQVRTDLVTRAAGTKLPQRSSEQPGAES